jgi:hypothetical protein
MGGKLVSIGLSCLYAGFVFAIHAGFQTLISVEAVVIKFEFSRNLCKVKAYILDAKLK